jgi:cellulose synthase/poly-beta-1,6-N-acetylglucosamine synthase-like glycosyltransferase
MKITDKILHITIIVPAYNEEKNISTLLSDLLSQKFNEENIIIKEVLVISCSNDKTDEIVEKISERNKIIRLIKEKERKGKAHAINLAMKLVKGSDIIVIVSADTRLPPHALNNLIRPFLKDKKVGLTTGSSLVYSKSHNKIIDFTNVFLWTLLNEVNNYYSVRGELAHSLGELYAYRKDLFEPLPKDVINEDQYIAFTIKRKGYRVMYVKDAKVIFRGPSTLQELLIQRARVNYGHWVAIRNYGVRPTIFLQLALTRPSDALRIVILNLRKFPTHNWFYMPFLIFLEFISHFLQFINPRRFSKPWEQIVSTKYKIEGDIMP